MIEIKTQKQVVHFLEVSAFTTTNKKALQALLAALLFGKSLAQSPTTHSSSCVILHIVTYYSHLAQHDTTTPATTSHRFQTKRTTTGGTTLHSTYLVLRHYFLQIPCLRSYCTVH